MKFQLFLLAILLVICQVLNAIPVSKRGYYNRNLASFFDDDDSQPFDDVVGGENDLTDILLLESQRQKPSLYF